MSFITNQIKNIPKAEQIKEPTELEVAIKFLEKETYLWIKGILILEKYNSLLDNTKPIQKAFNKSIKKVEAELTEHYAKENEKK